MAFHREEIVGSVHVPYNWSYADSTAREGASGFVAGDVGKLARQESDQSLWILTATTPTWVLIGSTATGSVEKVVLYARKASAGTIPKMQGTYITSFNPSGYVEVEQADADDSGKMPAAGVTELALTNTATGHIVVLGSFNSLNTSSFSINDELFISKTPGVLTNTRPTGSTTGIQKIAQVIRVHASEGQILVMGASRSNAAPNIAEGYIFIGDSDSYPATRIFTHASEHIDGTQDIQDATSGQKGLATAVQITKLDGIEALADVTDTANVTAAGAVMKTLVDAKGDLLAATADDTVARLAGGATDDYVLTYDDAEATGMKWAAVPGGSDVERVVLPCRKASAGTIPEGKALYIVSWNVGGWLEVEAARANSASTMPSIGISDVAITNSATVNLVFSGSKGTFDTSGWSVKDNLYVSAGTAGDLTSTKPTGAINLVQKVCQVVNSNVSIGSVQVFGAGRENDVPNIAEDNFWLGNSSGVATAVSIVTQVGIHGTKEHLWADQLGFPLNSDFPVNAHPDAAIDSNDARFNVLRFDDTTSQGVFFPIRIPTGATNIVFTFQSRAETAPGGAETVALSVYECEVPDNSTPTSWSSANDLTDLDIPTNEYFQTDSQSIALGTLGLTAGSTHWIELVRDTADGGDTLSGDWTLLHIGVSYT